MLVKVLYNHEDRKTENGEWVGHYSFIEDGVKYKISTRSKSLWDWINSRCKANPYYAGSENLFGNFQLFAEWCSQQAGYLNKDANGRFWHIDKDLMVNGNSSYSPDVCCFVPQYLNKIFSVSHRTGQYMLGVHLHKQTGKYRTQIRVGKTSKSLGLFEDEFMAHKAWVLAKIDMMRNTISRYSSESGFNVRLIESLQNRIDNIEERIYSNLEVVKF